MMITGTESPASSYVNVPADISMAIPKRLLTRRGRNQALPTEADLHRLAHEADLRFVARIANLRDNDMAEYEARFPAAVALRDQLGHARWEELERFRAQTAAFCAYTRRVDRERLQVARESLDAFLPWMRAWILGKFGQRELDRFEQLHLVPDAGNMAEFRRWFHHNPTLWLVYNQHFAAGERMEWLQQMQWLLWTLRHPQEREQKMCAVWNRALVEVYQTLIALRTEFGM